MNRNFLYFVLFAIVALLGSCKKDEVSYEINPEIFLREKFSSEDTKDLILSLFEKGVKLKSGNNTKPVVLVILPDDFITIIPGGKIKAKVAFIINFSDELQSKDQRGFLITTYSPSYLQENQYLETTWETEGEKVTLINKVVGGNDSLYINYSLETIDGRTNLSEIYPGNISEIKVWLVKEEIDISYEVGLVGGVIKGVIPSTGDHYDLLPTLNSNVLSKINFSLSPENLSGDEKMWIRVYSEEICGDFYEITINLVSAQFILPLGFKTPGKVVYQIKHLSFPNYAEDTVFLRAIQVNNSDDYNLVNYFDIKFYCDYLNLLNKVFLGCNDSLLSIMNHPLSEWEIVQQETQEICFALEEGINNNLLFLYATTNDLLLHTTKCQRNQVVDLIDNNLIKVQAGVYFIDQIVVYYNIELPEGWYTSITNKIEEISVMRNILSQ